MKIRLQLVCDSVPLSHGTLQIGGRKYTTNADGFTELILVKGQHQLTVSYDDVVLKRNVIIDGKQTHVIVDVTSRPTLEVVVEKLLGDRYKLKSILGRGGMGVVFKAEDRILKRLVAIKMLSGELEGNEEAQHFFLEEARALAPLVHPNLVAIHDILSVDAHTFMVLEYIIGENLDHLLKKGPLDEVSALRFILQITRAIAFMHSRGFIHRDIKPANAVVQQDGTLKIIDFGLAKSLEGIARNTSLRGTPAYMAPEQVVGKPMTPKVDIYQIGVTFYELLSGEIPFAGDVMYAHVHEKAPALADKNLSISLEISDLVARCMSKEPHHRPDADELMTILQALYLRGDDIEESELDSLLYERITKSHITGRNTAVGYSDEEVAFEHSEAPHHKTQSHIQTRKRISFWLLPLLLFCIFVGGAYFFTETLNETKSKLVKDEPSPVVPEKKFVLSNAEKENPIEIDVGKEEEQETKKEALKVVEKKSDLPTPKPYSKKRNIKILKKIPSKIKTKKKVIPKVIPKVVAKSRKIKKANSVEKSETNSKLLKIKKKSDDGILLGNTKSRADDILLK